MLSAATWSFERSARKRPMRPTPQTRFARRTTSRKKSPGRVPFSSVLIMKISLQETSPGKGADEPRKVESRLHPAVKPLPVKNRQTGKAAMGPRRRKDRRPEHQQKQNDRQGEDPAAAPNVRLPVDEPLRGKAEVHREQERRGPQIDLPRVQGDSPRSASPEGARRRCRTAARTVRDRSPRSSGRSRLCPRSAR